MKTFLVLFSIIASVQLSFGFFQELRYGDKNSKFVKREPPLRNVNPVPVVDNVHEGYITQRLDNFDPQNTQTFYMRYLLNIDNYVEGGPIFIVSLSQFYID